MEHPTLSTSPTTSVIGFSPRVFDYQSMMDPEPRRCRRTDGKKWRCSRNVIPDQKYCEQHMHRGRHRSRKHVEANKNIVESDNATVIKPSNTNSATSPHTMLNSDTSVSASIPTKLLLMIPSSNTSKNLPATAENITTSSSCSNDGGKNVSVSNKSSTTPPTIQTGNSNSRSKGNININRDTTITITATRLIHTAADKSNSQNNGNCIDGKEATFNNTNDRMVKRSSSTVNKGGFGGFIPPSFGFSPNSVLQSGIVTSCSTSGLDNTTSIEADLQRCKRTDGRKWRCSRDVLPHQKYCQQHMHRGARKPVVASELPTIDVSGPSIGSVRADPLAVAKKLDHRINLDTNLSISIPTNHQGTNGENNSTSCTSSDATTITDENPSICNMLALSP